MSADSFATLSSILPDMAHADRATRGLEAAGLPRSRISVLATDAAEPSSIGDSSESPMDRPSDAATIGGGRRAALVASLVAAGTLASGATLFAVGPALAATARAVGGRAASSALSALLGLSVTEETAATYERKLEVGCVVVAFSGAGGEVRIARQVLEAAQGSEFVHSLS